MSQNSIYNGGLHLCNDDTRPSGHISRPSQVDVFHSHFSRQINQVKVKICISSVMFLVGNCIKCLIIQIKYNPASPRISTMSSMTGCVWAWVHGHNANRLVRTVYPIHCPVGQVMVLSLALRSWNLLNRAQFKIWFTWRCFDRSRLRQCCLRYSGTEWAKDLSAQLCKCDECGIARYMPLCA